MDLEHITQDLAARLAKLTFDAPVACVYNPLEYAWEPHRAYLHRYGAATKEAVFLGMNPGPFGMAQTGVPFGDVVMTRDFLRISGDVRQPGVTHSKRPITGFGCPRREVSGSRLWGWARDRFVEPEAFFARFFVLNYCPLCFMEDSGRNLTPDKLPAHERARLYAICDAALTGMLRVLKPRLAIGVGRFAKDRLKTVCADLRVEVGMIPHPSPANPLANRGWAAAAESSLRDMGVVLEEY